MTNPENEPRGRPSPWRWVGYAFGGGLPERYDGWVLHDTTAGSWALRHLARIAVQLLVPVIAVYVLVPGPAWMRATMVVAGSVMALIFGFAYIDETTDHRLVKAGYPSGFGQRSRESRAVQRQHEANAARRARIAARVERRRAAHQR